MVVDVSTIVTTDEFDEFLGGQVTTGPLKLAPKAWNLDAKPALQFALDRILDSLRSRLPPIEYSDLADPDELRLGIYYGAAAHLYRIAMTSGQLGDINYEQRRMWDEDFTGWLLGFQPTLSGGLRGPSAMTVGVLRR